MYNSAAEFARETDYDASRIIDLIQTGYISTYKRKSKQCYKIPENEKSKIKKLIKPYKKWGKSYSKTEIYIIINNKDKSNEFIAKLINRNLNSVKIKRCRLRKEGYNV